MASFGRPSACLGEALQPFTCMDGKRAIWEMSSVLKRSRAWTWMHCAYENFQKNKAPSPSPPHRMIPVDLMTPLSSTDLIYWPKNGHCPHGSVTATDSPMRNLLISVPCSSHRGSSHIFLDSVLSQDGPAGALRAGNGWWDDSARV